MKNPPERSGFTLIEVLTVIAVIAILAGILIPAANSVRAKAGTAEATSKLRQLAVAANAYANDNNNYFPFPRQDENNPDAIPRRDGKIITEKWIDALGPYMDDAIGTGINEMVTSPNAETLPGSSRHFSLNKRIRHENWGGLRTIIPEPSKIVLFAEFNRTGGEEMDAGSSPVYEPDESAWYRISNPGNIGLYAFADGHVRALAGNRGWHASNNYSDDSPDTSAAEDKYLWQWWD